MPSALLWINACICEKLLIEQDQVISAIRIVEVFSISHPPDVPLDKQGTIMTLFLAGRVAADDNAEHVIEVFLERPNGETKPVAEPMRGVYPPSNYPGFPKGFNVGIQLGVGASQMGTHYFVIKFDGEEVRRVPFIFQKQPTLPATPKP